MSVIYKLPKLALHFLKYDVCSSRLITVATFNRKLSYTPIIYERDKDPGPTFIQPEVQSILKHLTRVDLQKVYRKRQLGTPHLSEPVYKFLTNNELQQLQQKAKRKIFQILQFPPVICVRKDIDWLIADNPEIQGLFKFKYVITDVTFGMQDNDRIITVRTPDGILRAADWATRKRMNQIYVPQKERYLKKPRMFDEPYFSKVLENRYYEFLLDRACCQYDPDDPEYQSIGSITYQHINENGEFDKLRSTRHFSNLVFFLTWHKCMDNLMIDLFRTEHVDEIRSLLKLYKICHNWTVDCDGDICDIIDVYVKTCSNEQDKLSREFQGFKEQLQETTEAKKAIEIAHGQV